MHTNTNSYKLWTKRVSRNLWEYLKFISVKRKRENEWSKKQSQRANVNRNVLDENIYNQLLHEQARSHIGLCLLGLSMLGSETMSCDSHIRNDLWRFAFILLSITSNYAFEYSFRLSGQKACMHVHNVYPYLLVRCYKLQSDLNAYMYEMSNHIDRVLNAALCLKDSVASQQVFKIEPVLTKQVLKFCNKRWKLW